MKFENKIELDEDYINEIQRFISAYRVFKGDSIKIQKYIFENPMKTYKESYGNYDFSLEDKINRLDKVVFNFNNNLSKNFNFKLFKSEIKLFLGLMNKLSKYDEKLFDCA